MTARTVIRHHVAPTPDGCRWCGYDNPHGRRAARTRKEN